MAKKSNTEINDIIVELLSRTSIGSIPPSELRELLKHIKDSYASLTNHIDLFGFKQHNPARSLNYELGEAVLKNGVLNISKGINSGTFNQTNYFALNKANILFELPFVNGAQSYNAGTIMQYEYRAFKKLNTSIAGDAYDEYEYLEVNVPLGYFGEPWAANTIYKYGMVVEATIDGRSVYLQCLYPQIKESPNSISGLKTEWDSSGLWAYVSESKPSNAYLVTSDFTLNNTDIGKRYYVNNGSYAVTISESIRAGFSAKFFSTSPTHYMGFETSGVLSSVGDKHDLTPKGSAEINAVADGVFNLFGNLN